MKVFKYSVKRYCKGSTFWSPLHFDAWVRIDLNTRSNFAISIHFFMDDYCLYAVIVNKVLMFVRNYLSFDKNLNTPFIWEYVVLWHLIYVIYSKWLESCWVESENVSNMIFESRYWLFSNPLISTGVILSIILHACVMVMSKC